MSTYDSRTQAKNHPANTAQQSSRPCGCGQSTNPCGCGNNGETQPECCDLVCPVQPRFFCGQLLTDADLTALLTWTKSRLRLARYRDGWGVVRGLDVRCGSGDSPGVIVTPGYAVTCCGDDVILCEEQPFPIGDACGAVGDPCEDPRLNAKAARLAARSGAIAAAAAKRDSGCVESTMGGSAETQTGTGCDLTLYIRYKEIQSAPQTVLRGGSCNQTGHCEPSRTNESFELYWQRDEIDPIQRRVEQWCSDYAACADIFDQFDLRRRRENISDETRTFQNWLVGKLNALKVRHFCFLNDWVCQLGTAPEDGGLSEVERERLLRSILVFLVLECRLNFFYRFEECCQVCDSTVGVPLARVYLEPDVNGRLKVAWTNPFPPHRRLLTRDDCWPACPGTWNLGRFIWQRLPDVCKSLREYGFEVDHRELVPSARVPFEWWERKIHDLLEAPPIVTCGEGELGYCPPDHVACNPGDVELCVYWVTAPDETRRVFAIAQGPSDWPVAPLSQKLLEAETRSELQVDPEILEAFEKQAQGQSASKVKGRATTSPKEKNSPSTGFENPV